MPFSIRPGVLTDITLESGGATTCMQWQGIRDSPKCSAFWVLNKQNVFRSLLFSTCTVTGVVYIDTEEWYPNIGWWGLLMSCYSCKMSASSFQTSLWHFLDWKLPRKWIAKGSSITWPPYSFSSHYTTWFLHPGVHKWCCPCSTGAHYLPELVGRMGVAAVVTVTLAMLINVWIKLTTDTCTRRGAQFSKNQGATSKF